MPPITKDTFPSQIKGVTDWKELKAIADADWNEPHEYNKKAEATQKFNQIAKDNFATVCEALESFVESFSEYGAANIGLLDVYTKGKETLNNINNSLK